MFNSYSHCSIKNLILHAPITYYNMHKAHRVAVVLGMLQSQHLLLLLLIQILTVINSNQYGVQ